MKQFQFRADCTFTAENLDDAFHQLEQHFHDLRTDTGAVLDRPLDMLGTMELNPVE